MEANSVLITKTRLFNYIENFTIKKPENFQIKKNWYFHVLLKTDCVSRRGGSNEYPQSMFLSRSKKNNVYPF